MANLIVVTGASGFLGAHYLKYTATAFPTWELVAQVRSTPLGFSRPNLSALTCDLTRPGAVEVLAGLKPDVIVHMAAAIMEDDARQLNATMMEHVLEACRRSGAKLIYISSSQVHFSRLNQYALSKVDDEAAVQASGLPHVIFRPAAPYGPLMLDHAPAREQSMHVLAKFITKLPAVPVIGNGRYTRQPVHVDDFNMAINHFIEADAFEGQVFDIGGPRPYSMDEIIALLARIVGKRVFPVHLPKELFIGASYVIKTFHKDLLSTTDCDEEVDNGPLLAALGKDSFIPFEEGATCLF
jgi:nucleoside-diphosphate-sugar epimerase